MSDNSTLIRIILIIVLIWIALNVFGEFLNVISNSLVLAVLAVVLILWYLDII